MAKKYEKGRVFGFILYPKIFPQDLYSVFSSMFKLSKFRAAALSPLHSPDWSIEDKESEVKRLTDASVAKIKRLKDEKKIAAVTAALEAAIEELATRELKKHYHLMVVSEYPITSECCYRHLHKLYELVGLPYRAMSFTRPNKISSAASYFRYLTHLDDWDKEQFVENPLVVPNGFKFERGYRKFDFVQKERILGVILNYCFLNKISPSDYYLQLSASSDNQSLEVASIIRLNFHFLVSIYENKIYRI